MDNSEKKYNKNNEYNNSYQNQEMMNYTEQYNQDLNYSDAYHNQEIINYNEQYNQDLNYSDSYHSQEMMNYSDSFQNTNFNDNFQNQDMQGYNDYYNQGTNDYDINYQDQNINYNTQQYQESYNVYNDNNQFATNNQEYYEQNDNNFNQVYEEYPEPKKRTGIILLVSFLIVGLIAISGYFAYNKYVVNKKAVVDLNQYEIEFKPYGTDGDGTAAADIKKVPTVENADGSVTQFLQEPTITYSKSNNLKNGEKVEVTISLSKSSADAKKLELKGEFKRSYTVRGLSEKSKDNSSKSSSSSIVLREDSSVNTKELSDSQVGDWARAIYIKEFSRNSSTSDFSYDVWLGSDHLAYVNLKKDRSIVGKYRVNASGRLEHYENSGWVVVSSTFTS